MSDGFFVFKRYAQISFDKVTKPCKVSRKDSAQFFAERRFYVSNIAYGRRVARTRRLVKSESKYSAAAFKRICSLRNCSLRFLSNYYFLFCNVAEVIFNLFLFFVIFKHRQIIMILEQRRVVAVSRQLHTFFGYAFKSVAYTFFRPRSFVPIQTYAVGSNVVIFNFVGNFNNFVKNNLTHIAVECAVFVIHSQVQARFGSIQPVQRFKVVQVVLSKRALTYLRLILVIDIVVGHKTYHRIDDYRYAEQYQY